MKLPGLDIPYEIGLRLYQCGTAFGITDRNTVSIAPHISAFVERVGTLEGLDVRGQGSFNIFYDLSPDLQIEALSLGGFDGGSANVGMRRGKPHRGTMQKLSGDDAYEMEKAWAELWYGLLACVAGVGPKIYAAGFTSKKEVVVFLQKGIGELKELADSRLVNVDGQLELQEKPWREGFLYAASLFKVINDVSQMGMILCDIKPGNIIMMNDTDVLLIDFDPAFTVILDEDNSVWDPECIVFLNTFLLLSSARCHANSSAMQGATYLLPSNLMMLMYNIKTKGAATSLCSIFLRMKRDEALRLPGLMRASREQPQRLVQSIMHHAGHYLGWWRAKFGGQDSRCGPPYSYDDRVPVIEQIALRLYDEALPAEGPLLEAE